MSRRRARFANHLDSLSYGSILTLWLLNVLVFALIYLLLSTVPGHGPIASGDQHQIRSFWDSLYFSIITATSTGYGDIVPIGLSRAFASIESFSGILLFAFFVSKLLSRRQDVALTEVHELAFQTAFHNMREDLYTARKDLDHGIAASSTKRSLSQSEWDQISIAFQQIGHLLHEVPSFYEHENELYTIDARRERLLIEAVERTLLRVVQFLQAVRAHGENSVIDPQVHTALLEMVAEGERSVPIWKKHSSRGDGAALAQIQETLGRIRNQAH